MTKTIIFTALALGLIVTQAATYGPAQAFRERVTCPVFTAEMVDAAGLGALLLNVDPPVVLRDVPAEPDTECQFGSFGGAGLFRVAVDGLAANASLQGSNQALGGQTVLFAGRGGLSQSESFACRAEVLRSLVWKQHCAPFLP